MPEILEGSLEGRGMRIGIVVSRFNEMFTERLLRGALECLQRHGVDDDAVQVVHVPGAFEIPLAAQTMVRGAGVDAVICLGAVIRGATAHFEYVSSSVASGVARVTLESEMPVIFGVLTTDTLEQTMERSGSESGNKGWESAQAAIQMVHVLRGLRRGDA